MAEAEYGQQYNLRNPAVKRILQEVKEMRKEASKDYIGEPLEVGVATILSRFSTTIF